MASAASAAVRVEIRKALRALNEAMTAANGERITAAAQRIAHAERHLDRALQRLAELEAATTPTPGEVTPPAARR